MFCIVFFGGYIVLLTKLTKLIFAGTFVNKFVSLALGWIYMGWLQLVGSIKL